MHKWLDGCSVCANITPTLHHTTPQRDFYRVKKLAERKMGLRKGGGRNEKGGSEKGVVWCSVGVL